MNFQCCPSFSGESVPESERVNPKEVQGVIVEPKKTVSNEAPAIAESGDTAPTYEVCDWMAFK